MAATDLDDSRRLQVTNQRVVNRRVKTTEEIVLEIKIKVVQFVTVTRQFTEKSYLVFRVKVDARVRPPAIDLLRGDRTEIRQRLVIMNWTNVITPAVGEVGATLGQEQQMVRGAGRNRLEQSERGAIEE